MADGEINIEIKAENKTDSTIKEVEKSLKKIQEPIQLKIIADISTIQEQIAQARAKLRELTGDSNQDARIRVRMDITELQQSLTQARSKLREVTSAADNEFNNIVKSHQKRSGEIIKGIEKEAREQERIEREKTRNVEREAREQARVVKQIQREKEMAFKARSRETAAIMRAELAEFNRIEREKERAFKQRAAEMLRIERDRARQEQALARQRASEMAREAREAAAMQKKSSMAIASLGRTGRDLLLLFTGRQLTTMFRDIGRSAIQAAKEFDTAFVGVRKTVDGTEEQFSRLRREFQELATGMNAIPLAVTEIMSIAQIGGQLGVVVGDLRDFTETIARVSVATNLISEGAATSFARISEVMQLPINEMDRLASTVVKLGNNFATTEREIVEFTTRIAGAASIVGVGADEVNGMSAAFTAVGVQAEAGGTAVQKVLLKLNSVVNEGGEELERFADFLGLTSEQFKRMFENDPGEVFRRFVESLSASGKEASAILGELVTNDVRLQRAFLSVASAGDLMNRTMDMSKQEFKDNNELMRESEERFNSVGGQLGKISNTFSFVARTIGEAVMPAYIGFLKIMSETFSVLFAGEERFGAFTSVIRVGLIGAMAAATLVMSSLVSSLLGFNRVLSNVRTALIGTTGATNVFSASLVRLRAALLAVNPWILAFTIALGTIVSVIMKAQKQVEDLAIAFDKLRASTERFEDMGVVFRSFDPKRIEDTTKELQRYGAELNKLERNKFLTDVMSGGLLTSATASGTVNPLATGALLGLREELQETSRQADMAIESIRFSIEQAQQTLTDDLSAMLGLIGKGIEDFDGLGDAIADVAINGRDAAESIELIAGVQEEVFTKLPSRLQHINDSFVNMKKSGEDTFDALFKASMRFSRGSEEVAKDYVDLFAQNLLKGEVTLEKAAEYLAIRTGQGFNNAQSIQMLEQSGLRMSGVVVSGFLREAIQANKAGEAYGILLGIGLDSQRVKNAQTAEELRDAILEALNNPEAFASAEARARQNAATVVRGIINGILAQLPGLNDAVNAVLNSIGRLASLPGLSGISDLIGGRLGGMVSMFKNIGNSARDAAKQAEVVRRLQEDINNPAPSSGGGGGGGRGAKEIDKDAEAEKKRLEEEKKALEAYLKNMEEQRNTFEFKQAFSRERAFAKERQELIKERDAQREINKRKAQKTVEDYKRAMSDLQRESERITKAIDAFFKSLDKSIQDTVQGQVQLVRELKSNQEDLKSSFIEDAASRELAIRNRILDIEKERKKMNEEQSTDLNKYIEMMQEEQRLRDELTEVESIRKALTEEEIALYDALLKRMREREKLTDTGRLLEEFQYEAEQLNKTFEEAYAQQQRFIDAQERLKSILSSGEFVDKEIFETLKGMTNLDFRSQEGAILDYLDSFGFGGLTGEQAQELLGMVRTAADLQQEKDLILQQQEEIMNAKINYEELIKEYVLDSVAEQKEAYEDLLVTIRQAIAAAQQLGSLAVNTGSSGQSGNTTNVNIANNISSDVDWESNQRQMLMYLP